MQSLTRIVCVVLLTSACASPKDPCSGTVSAPFRPPEGCTYLFAGQDLARIGGSPEDGHTDGYLDHVSVQPSGITLYGTFPEVGASNDLNALPWVQETQRFLDRPANKDLIVHLSIAWVPESLADNQSGREAVEQALLAGQFDTYLDQLADWLSARSQPILLRLGYEFNRPLNVLYSQPSYAACFRHIVDRLRARHVKGTAFVWASANLAFTPDDPPDDTWDFDAWYPGDDYVDWFAFSMWFPKDWDTVMLAQARARHRPVLLAETTPLNWNVGTKESFPLFNATGTAVSSEALWEGWWHPMIRFTQENADVVAGWHYIAEDWHADPLWSSNPLFATCDARLWLDSALLSHWTASVSQAPFVQRGAVKFVR